jgi:hypothetical protein
MWNELDGQRARLDEEFPGDEVEWQAQWCQETLRNILDHKAKKIEIWAQSKR